MKPVNHRPLKLYKAVLIIAVFVLLSMLLSCKTSKDIQYKVLSVEKVKGNAYRIKTDSFTVIRIVRGAGRYHPKTISKQGYLQ